MVGKHLRRIGINATVNVIIHLVLKREWANGMAQLGQADEIIPICIPSSVEKLLGVTVSKVP